jgi:plastocyanin
MKMSICLTALFLTLPPTIAVATTHIVTFTCCQYTPSQFQASVGDTVIWQGDFFSHPLRSSTIPAGAASFAQSSGTSLSYVLQVAGTYNFRCDFHGGDGMTGTFTTSVTSVEDDHELIPRAFRLDQNYPNPFNPSTKITFDVAVAGMVSLKVYNLLGKEVAELVSERKEAGLHTIEFNGAQLPSGVYLYRLQAENFNQTRKLLLLR